VGGNDFHGRTTSRIAEIQANNLDDKLRAHGSATSLMKSFYDVSADLGGRVIGQAVVLQARTAQAKSEGVLGSRKSGRRRQVPDRDDVLATRHDASQIPQSCPTSSRRTTGWSTHGRAAPRRSRRKAGRFTRFERGTTRIDAIQKIELQSMLNPRVS